MRALYFCGEMPGSAGILPASAAGMPALPSEICNAASNRGFESRDVLAGVGDHSSQPCVKFKRTGCAGHFHDVARMEAGAGQNRYAISSLLDERSKNGHATWRIGSAPRSQNAMRASENDVFQGCGEVFCFVKSAVKRHFQRRGQSDKLTGALPVYRTIRQKDAGNNPLHVFPFDLLY